MKRFSEIKITHIFVIILVVVFIMALVVGFSMSKSSESLRELQENTEEYIKVQESISSMKEASDYLTEHCRAFVVSGDSDHLQNYFNEVEVDRRRDKAVEVISEYNESDYIKRSLNDSLKYSNELMEIELYAMKMSAEGHGIKDEITEKYLSEIVLNGNDTALSDEDKIKKATHMVFDEEYESYKTAIRKGVFDGLDNLIKDTRSDQLASYSMANRILHRSHILFFIMLLLMVIVLFIMAFGVIIPINRSIAFIQKNEKMPAGGSAEYAFLAETFNRMLDKNRKHSELLSYEATHDELTGVYNRKLFEEKRRELIDEDTALILFDVDYFKEVNDSYGHEVGDKILKKVASAIMSSFRSDDYVCRIGGDEFAVLMVHMNPEISPVVKMKIDRVTEKISIDDGLPKTTLSIGAAFSSDSDVREDLFRNADEALYRVKNAGRNGFAFYIEHDKKEHAEKESDNKEQAEKAHDE